MPTSCVLIGYIPCCSVRFLSVPCGVGWGGTRAVEGDGRGPSDDGATGTEETTSEVLKCVRNIMSYDTCIMYRGIVERGVG